MMKKTIKNLLSVIVILGMLSSLVACGSTSSTTTTTTGEQTTAETTASGDTASAEQTGSSPSGQTSPDEYGWPKFITFLGASSGGNAILSVSALGTVLGEHLPTTVSSQVTPGSSQNMYLMEQGEGSYAWGTAYSIYAANNGLDSYAEKPCTLEMDQLLMYSSSIWQIGVRKGSGISSIEDLRGKKVVVGAAGGGTESTVRMICKALGLYTDEGGYDFSAEYSGVTEGCEMISNGQADASFLAGSVPMSAFTELFVTDKIELIGMSDEEVDKIEAANIGMSEMTIPAGSYEGKVPSELKSVAGWAGLICRADANEDEVYWMVRTLCENWDELGNYHDMFKAITAEGAAKACISEYADIHPGALKYFKEQGWM